MRKEKIVMFWPHLPEKKLLMPELEKIFYPLDDSGQEQRPWIGHGKKVEEFEEKLGKKFGLDYLVALNNGTSGLKLALSMCDVGYGNEVITSALTCTATNHPILEQQAIPIFTDVQYASANLNPDDLEKRITEKTKAIICVHWGGYPCDMDEINIMAKKYNLPVIADGAHAIGATYKGKPIGATADFTMFSLQAIKQITTGDGGILSMIPRQSEGEFEDLKNRCWYGIDRKGRKPTVLGHPLYDVTSIGGKYHMNDIAATIGILQLEEIDKIYSRRKEITEKYNSKLKNIPGINLFERREDRESSNWLYTMHVEDRFQFAKMMDSKQIESSVVHWRNDMYSVFGINTPIGKVRKLREDLPNTDKLHKDMISIPLHMRLTDDDVDYIIKSIKEGW